MRIDLNVDLGEGGGADAQLIALASSVNIACGGHAGDEATMLASMTLAAHRGVAVGAHPGFEDRASFGRRMVEISPADLRDALDRQLGRFAEIAHAQGIGVRHVKPHGALYHQADSDASLAEVFLDAVQHHLPGAAVTAPPRGLLDRAMARRGMELLREGFADRLYGSDGRLVPRGEPGAVIEDPYQAVSQALELAPQVDTLCVHGDGAAALGVLTAVRAGLQKAGWTIAAPGFHRIR